MKSFTAALAVIALLLPFSDAHGQRVTHTFSFNAAAIGGSNGSVFLAGGGTYDSQSGFAHGGGAFRCTADINQGPFAGLRAGDGARWEIAQILPSSGFKCSGSAAEPLKTAVTDDDTVVLQARFYRQGDGNVVSFTAKVFVSGSDEDPDQFGTQNIWIQGVGCGEATVSVR